MAEEDIQDKRDRENKEQLMIALALLLYPRLNEQKIETIEDLPAEVREEVQKKIDEGLDKSIKDATEQKTQLAELKKDEILAVAMALAGINATYLKVITVGDKKTCDKCKQWDGRIISDSDPKYPSFEDLTESGALHINCRCFLKPVQKKDIMNSETELDNMAMNAEPLKDEVVYRGFVDADLDTNITYDFGETLVMITPLGEFVGSSQDGKPTKEIVDEDSVKMMEQQKEEILLDRDHSSMRPVTDRDTSACGWISGLKAITNLGDMSGLYAIIKWTSEGIKLVQDRIYRFLSPVFQLDENGKAVKLVNVGLTNRPALKMMPIINSEAENDEDKISITKEKDMEEEKKEEVVVDNSCSEKKEEEVKNETTEKDTEETIQEAVNEAEEKSQQDAAEEAPVEKPAEPEVAEVAVVEEEKEEIIKEEVLNSVPAIGADIAIEPEWKKLNYSEFLDWYKKNGRNYR